MLTVYHSSGVYLWLYLLANVTTHLVQLKQPVYIISHSSHCNQQRYTDIVSDSAYVKWIYGSWTAAFDITEDTSHDEGLPLISTAIKSIMETKSHTVRGKNWAKKPVWSPTNAQWKDVCVGGLLHKIRLIEWGLLAVMTFSDSAGLVFFFFCWLV